MPQPSCLTGPDRAPRVHTRIRWSLPGRGSVRCRGGGKEHGEGEASEPGIAGPEPLCRSSCGGRREQAPSSGKAVRDEREKGRTRRPGCRHSQRQLGRRPLGCYSGMWAGFRCRGLPLAFVRRLRRRLPSATSRTSTRGVGRRSVQQRRPGGGSARADGNLRRPQDPVRGHSVPRAVLRAPDDGIRTRHSDLGGLRRVPGAPAGVDRRTPHARPGSGIPGSSPDSCRWWSMPRSSSPWRATRGASSGASRWPKC